MSRDDSYMAGYQQANKDARQDWRAFVADNIMDQVDKEAITAHEIDVRGAARTIKFLIDHLDECEHAKLRRPEPDGSNQMITTLDMVQEWLENMGGVLGATGFSEPDEESSE